MGHGVVTALLERLRIVLLVDAREVLVGTLGVVTLAVKVLVTPEADAMEA